MAKKSSKTPTVRRLELENLDTVNFLTLSSAEILDAAVKLQALSRARRRLYNSLAKRHEEVFTDELTGLASRRFFMEELERSVQIHATRLGNKPFGILILDLDHFKAINDGPGGHAMGDQALVSFAGILRTTVRVDDLPGRIGGDEFAVILQYEGDATRSYETVVGEFRAVGERIRHRIQVSTVPRVTTTIGLAVWQGGMSTEEVLKAADAALYRAKDAGRNRVEVAP
jgi:diguanylate cyclase (GGDEF)-like protein